MALQVLTALLLAALPVAGQTPETPAPAAQGTAPRPAALIEVDPPAFDFGTVWEGEPAVGKIAIKNVSDKTVQLHAKSSCGCTVPTQPKDPIPPGETFMMTVEYRTSYVGKAHKKITLVCVHPRNLNVVIPVRGVVNPLFKAKPYRRLSFGPLDTTTEDRKTLVFENAYTQPIHLKLNEDACKGPFRFELTTLEPGQKYELIAHTTPPLKPGWNPGKVAFATGLKHVPTISMPVTAHVPRKVELRPPRIYLDAHRTESTRQLLQVRYRATSPVKINEIKTEPESIKFDVMSSGTMPDGAKFGVHRIYLQLPPPSELPRHGCKVIIRTDSDDEDYKELVVPIYQRQVPKAVRPTPGRSDSRTDDAPQDNRDEDRDRG
jgi:hypothetical protein